MWLWIIGTIAAFFIKGLCGFANTLVLTSIVGFGANNISISPVELVLGYPSNLILIIKNRKELKPKFFIPVTLMVLAGNIPGALLLKNVNAQYIKIFFGVVVILVGIEMLLREHSVKKHKSSTLVMIIIGLISGALCGLFGIGVLLAAYFSRITDSGNEFKANLSAVFFAENTFRIILYSVLGIINLQTLKLSAMLLPAMLAGLFLGMKCSTFMNEKIAKKIVIILLIISGLAMVLLNLNFA